MLPLPERNTDLGVEAGVDASTTVGVPVGDTVSAAVMVGGRTVAAGGGAGVLQDARANMRSNPMKEYARSCFLTVRQDPGGCRRYDTSGMELEALNDLVPGFTDPGCAKLQVADNAIILSAILRKL